MAARTDKYFVVIIDLCNFQITQILTFKERFRILEFKHSKYDRTLYLDGFDMDTDDNLDDLDASECILKFGICQRMSLQELCINVIVNYFCVSEIKSFRLPQFLIEEILTVRYIDVIVWYCSL